MSLLYLELEQLDVSFGTGLSNFHFLLFDGIRQMKLTLSSSGTPKMGADRLDDSERSGSAHAMLDSSLLPVDQSGISVLLNRKQGFPLLEKILLGEAR